MKALYKNLLYTKKSENFIQNKVFSRLRKFNLILLFALGASAVSAQCILEVEASVGACVFDEQTNQSRVLVAVSADWSNEPAGQLIEITFQGMTRTIDPATDGCPAYVQYIVPADGSMGNISARFSGGSCIAAPVPYTLPAACPAPPACGGNDEIGGRVFNDFDSDGRRDASEFGLEGVTVTVYDCFGDPICTTVSGQNGRWVCENLPAGTPVRVEFSDYPLGYSPGNSGPDNKGGAVQFTTVGNCTTDFGIYDPATFCQNNPYVITPCYVNGNPLINGASANGDVLVAVPYGQADKSSGGNEYVAINSEVGTVWGTSYDKKSKTLFTSAFLKRHSGLGPSGLGAIYKSDLGQIPPVNPSGNSSLYINLDNYGVNTGNEASIIRDLPATATGASYDGQAFDLIGKVGLGGLAVAEEKNTLYTVNLNSKTLVIIEMGATPNDPPLSVREVPIPDPGCSSPDDWRPWAVTYKYGRLFVGGVCSAQSTRATTPPRGDREELGATIYEFDLTTEAYTEAISFPLDYVKGSATSFLGGNDPQKSKQWNPWTDDFNDVIASGRELSYPQPILSDIEIDVYGNMTIGFIDRTGHQVGWYNYGTSAAQFGTQTYKGNAGGDVLRAYNNNGTWLLEQNGRSGYASTSGANNNQGPCGGEFYFEDAFGGSHQEVVHGGLAIHPSNNELLLNVMDPFNAYSAGLAWYNNATGRVNKRYEVYKTSGSSNQGLFGKAAGLGDMELICDDATLQIGNYVWEDTNQDGVQDPCEPPLVGVVVELYDANGIKVAMTTTNEKGEYYFDTVNGLTPDTEYYIVFGNSQTTNEALTINGETYTPTINSGAGANAGLNDSNPDPDVPSNGLPGNIPDGLPYINYTTGSNGQNDHTLDAGFILRTFDLALTKVINTTATPGPYESGDLVTFTITIVNQGNVDASNVQVNDYIPTGFTLADGNWTNNSGIATLNTIIPNLAAGATTTREITLMINDNFEGDFITNLAEIASAENIYNLSDIDSTPDAIRDNDAGGRAASTSDNALDGNGMGTPGGTDPATDEDDHDPARVPVQQVFDLALRKTLISSGPFSPGAEVSYLIEIINQGSITATNVQVTDYIPMGLILDGEDTWTQLGNTAVLINRITAIAPNTSIQLEAKFTIANNFQGGSIRNWAEISAAQNALGLQDVDSTPDGTNFNQNGETNDLDDDNVVDQNGKNNEDEDDHDPAEIQVEQIFDLALQKTLSPTTQVPFEANDPVTFIIEVFNQGTIDATGVFVSDYIPEGLILNDAEWTSAANVATRMLPITIPVGESRQVEIDFYIDPSFTGSVITNFAEISSAQNALGLQDIDSTPDMLNDNDPGGAVNSPADNSVDGDGTGTVGDGIAETDEDDHDPAQIIAGNYFDLALRKTVNTNQTSLPLSPGDLVTFTIEVINQGTVTATDIEIVDYIPTTSASLADPDWTLGISGSSTVARYNTPIASLAPSASVFIDITFRIRDDLPGGTVLNYAEIADAQNALGLEDIDSTPDEDLINDGGGVPGGATDNYVDGNGDALFGDDTPANDEDDHDPAVVPFGSVFDMALRKIVDPTPGVNDPPYEPGEVVQFAMAAINQGTITATNVQVSDYIPAGTTLAPGYGWTETSPGIATLDANIASIAPGSFQVLFIGFIIDENFQGDRITNVAEISNAENSVGANDIDSRPDNDNTNDAGGLPNSPADDFLGAMVPEIQVMALLLPMRMITIQLKCLSTRHLIWLYAKQLPVQGRMSPVEKLPSNLKFSIKEH